MESATSDFDKLLKQRWTKVYESKEASEIFRNDLKQVEQKEIGGKFHAYINKRYNKRESEIKLDAPKNEDDGVVFKSFDDSKFNFNKVDEREIMLYIDLDQEEVLPPEKVNEVDEENFLNDQECEDEITKTERHPVLINNAPLFMYHSLLTLFPQEELPQVIGSEILTFMLQVFKLSSSPFLRCGYNSIGGWSSVNHLHFQLVYSDLIFKDGKFPVENFARKEFLKTSLQNPKEEINLYSVGVVIEEIPDYPVHCLVVRPLGDGDDADIFQSLGFAAGTVTNTLLEKKIPHNLLISDGGKTIYIFPRKYQMAPHDDSFRCAWLELSGLAFCRTEEAYKKVTADDFTKLLARDASLDTKHFEAIKQDIKALFKQFA